MPAVWGTAVIPDPGLEHFHIYFKLIDRLWQSYSQNDFISLILTYAFCIACLSYEQRVCPSICLSQAVIESRQMNIGSCSANCSAQKSFWLSPSTVASSVTTQSTCDSTFWVGSQKGPIDLGNESEIILLPDARRKTGLFMAGHHDQILNSLGHLSLQVPL